MCDEYSEKFDTVFDWRQWIIDGFKEHYTKAVGVYKPSPSDHHGPAYFRYPDVD